MSNVWRLIVAALGLGVALAIGSTAGAAPENVAAAHPTLLLEGQTQWIATGSPTAAAPFVLDLATRTAPPGAVVSAAVYSRLRTRDDFKNAVKNGPRGYPIARGADVPFSSLPPDPRTTSGSDLQLQVVETATTPSGSTGGERVGLGCAPPTGPGTCTGVYPVEITLSDVRGKALDHLTTFLTYQSAKSAHPLELALVAPISAPVTVTGHPSGPNALQPLPAHDASSLETFIATLHANAAVPLTVDASPETLQQLQRSGSAGRGAVKALGSMSSSSTTTEVLPTSYSPVDLGALEGAGEPTEVAAQIGAGTTTLRRLHVSTADAPPAWVVTGPTSGALLRALAHIGDRQVVLPGADLSEPTPVADRSSTVAGTWTSTFGLTSARAATSTGEPGAGASSRSGIQGALSDTWLSGQFAHVSADPALSASQILADLAMVHFERPNTPAARGMVAVPPPRAAKSSEFWRVLLRALAHDPDVTPVTLSDYFSTVETDGVRSLQPTKKPALQPKLAHAISAARVRLSDFADTVAGSPPVLAKLDHDLLAAESTYLSSRRKLVAVDACEHALSGQLGLVSFATERTFTLTARTGWIPVTIDSRAPYTLVGTLSVNGNKFIFPHGPSNPSMHLDRSTNLWRVEVRVRTSGDLPLHVSFTSPNGRLVIADGLLTVRSTATSIVGVVLTVVALAILLTWWAGTWWAGRRRRRALRDAPDPS